MPTYESIRYREWLNADPERKRQAIERSKKWNKQNPERCAKAALALYYRTRDFVIAQYGGECSHCGTTQRLQMHHKLLNGKAHRAELGTRAIYSWLKTNGCPKSEFILLCFTCHRELHRVEKIQLKIAKLTATL